MSGSVGMVCWLIFLMGLHPVPKENHDRRILLRTTQDRIQVLYRHEVDETRALYDLTEHEVDLSHIRDRNDVYRAYADLLRKRIPGNLVLMGPKGEIPWETTLVHFEELDHLRVDLLLEAPRGNLPVGASLSLEEGNYASDPLSLVLLAPWGGPNLVPGKRFLSISATWEDQFVGENQATERPPSEEGIIDLILGQQHGLPILVFFAMVFGAGHALTPGHGKTMVAAYLIGQRGTIPQAILLGLVTTLTHTAAVIVIAALLPILVPDAKAEDVQRILNLVGGLLLAGLGGWLLLLRLSGLADHHHGPGGHSHGPSIPKEGKKTSSWGVIVLGITGGLVPCWDAVAMLVFAMASGRTWLALPLLIAFSAGLASVLVALGIVVVKSRDSLQKRTGGSDGFERWTARVAIISALLITGMGVWLCARAGVGG